MATSWDLFDKQQGKTLKVHPKRAVYLATAYPYRFQLTQQNQTTGENKMPALPTATKTLDNGIHVLNAIEVKTVNGQYGPQEEVLCLKEGTEDTMTRVWVPHNNLKRITEASKAGLVTIHVEDKSWEVVLGARFQVFVAGGKIVAVTPPPAQQIQNGQ